MSTVVRDKQRTNNITHSRKPHQNHPATVQDEDKEVLNKFVVVDDDDDVDELAITDEEYHPDPDEQEDDLDEEEKKLEYSEEYDGLSTAGQEEEEVEMVKADEREVQAGGDRRCGAGTGGNVASIAAAELSTKSKNNSRKDGGNLEVQTGGGHRRGTGTVGDVASAASSNKSSSTKNSSISNDDRDDEEGEGEELMHNKRSRAGYTGDSAKVGCVNSDTAMIRAKLKVDGPEESDPSANNNSATPFRAPGAAARYHKKGEDDEPDYDQGSKLWHKIYSSELRDLSL